MEQLFETRLNELLGYKNLQDGWDGDYSSGPTEQDLENAVHVFHLWPKQLPILIPMINYEGKIGFYTDNEEYYLDLEIEENNQFSLFIRSRKDKGVEAFLDSVPINENLESVVLAQIKDVTTEDKVKYDLFK